MRICIVGAAGATHIEKWSKYLSEFGHEITIVSLVDFSSDYSKVICIDKKFSWDQSDIKKARVLLYANKIRKTIEEIKPDIINVHYATSYGIMTAISGVDNYILSVWGSDVYDFPRKSFLHRILLKYSLHRASHVFSTSHAMKEETRRYTDKEIDVTPFGVDMELFNPNKRKRETNDSKIVIGTVKTLTEKYGISYLIKSFCEACKFYQQVDLELRIAGQGPQEKEYKQLVEELGLQNSVKFLGFISQEQAAVEWANMDIGIIYSTLESESFGVSAVEALASGVPTIISDVPGLVESTGSGKNAIVVQRKNQDELNKALINLIRDVELRENLSVKGRHFVQEEYSAENCFRHIESLFQKYKR